MSDDAVLAVIDALNALSVEYMLVGSFSSNFYGIPRSTKDADFVFQLGNTKITEIARELTPRFRLDVQASFELITGTTKYVVHCLDVPFTIELFLLSPDLHDDARFHRRSKQEMLGRPVFLPTAEDVIITKLRWAVNRPHAKDRDDVAAVISMQRPNLDWTYIHSWCDQHGTRQLLDEILQTIPEV